MRTVFLHGEAGRLFGKKFRLDVDTLAEAVRAIGVQVKGFQQYVMAHNFRCVRGRTLKNGFELGDQDVTFRLGGSDLHIVPVIAGSGGSGRAIGKIVAGVLLAGVAFFAAPAAGGLGATIFGSVTYGKVATLGIGLAVTGVTQFLSPQPKNKKTKVSHNFGGTLSVTNQGTPVPYIYGRVMLKNPPIISAGIHTEDVAP